MDAIAQAFTDHRRLLWGLGYRMLGTPADADEVVQEAFVRALRSPPDLDRPLRPWLVRVTVNVARDRLRRRKRAPYEGQWLPAPIEEGDGGCDAVRHAEPAVDPDLPHERLEQVSYALLVALERLSPTQRAVWLLRDVMGLSTAETAEVLSVGDGSVRVALHRARRALDEPGRPAAEPVDGMAAVAALARAILTADVTEVMARLSDDVVATTDSGGHFPSARRPIVGADAVARFFLGLARKAPDATWSAHWLAGCPAVALRLPAGRGMAPVQVLLFSPIGDRIHRIWTVSAPDKLAAP